MFSPGPKFFSRFGAEGAVQVLAFLGLRLEPHQPIQDLIRVLYKPTSAAQVPRGSPVSDATTWFSDNNVFPRHAVICPMNKEEEAALSKLIGRLNVQKIEAVIGYRFQEKSFLIEAFTHTSYLPNCLTRSYERLEVS